YPSTDTRTAPRISCQHHRENANYHYLHSDGISRVRAESIRRCIYIQPGVQKRIPADLVPFLVCGDYSRDSRMRLLNCAAVSTPCTPPTQDAHPLHRSKPQQHRPTHKEGNCWSLDWRVIIICYSGEY